jgi:hypothetical protein
MLSVVSSIIKGGGGGQNEDYFANYNHSFPREINLECSLIIVIAIIIIITHRLLLWGTTSNHIGQNLPLEVLALHSLEDEAPLGVLSKLLEHGPAVTRPSHHCGLPAAHIQRDLLPWAIGVHPAPAVKEDHEAGLRGPGIWIVIDSDRLHVLQQRLRVQDERVGFLEVGDGPQEVLGVVQTVVHVEF